MASDAPLVVAWGELLWDLFPDGRCLGGAPANVAYHLTQLGNDAALVSRVGLDALGDSALAELDGLGVSSDAVQRDPTHRTGTVTVDLAAGEPRYVIEEDVAWDYIEADEAGARFGAASVFVFGTLAQRTAAARQQLEAALGALPSHCLRLCDLNLRPPHDATEALDLAIEAAGVLKLNEAELAVLGARFGVEQVTAWLLHDRDVELVAVTRGARGCTLLSKGQQWHAAGLSAAAGGDPVGAGDAYTAVLAHHLARSTPPNRIGDAANRYAAHVAGCRGAMPAIPREVAAAARL